MIMKTHNALIYHCLHCGNVVHNDMQARAPECCGHEMIAAAAETIFEREGAIPVESGSVHCEMTDLANKPR
jgi:DNA-directed RNA polymerase subunit RPC12/RpoP